jgi:L-2,4-diaminobutyrate decarboxylase
MFNQLSQQFLSEEGSHFLPLKQFMQIWEKAWYERSRSSQIFLSDQKEDIFTEDNLFLEDCSQQRSFEETLQQMIKSLLQGQMPVYHPYVFAHLHCPVMTSSLMADFLIHSMNQSMDSWDQAPMATMIEEKVIKDLCTLLHYQNGDGVFTSGGTQSNLMGLLLAREKAKECGYPLHQLRAYTSEVTHFSIRKGWRLLGFSDQQLIVIPVDSTFCIDLTLLAEQIAQDKKEGLIPFLLVGTYGTTNFGSLDPISHMSLIAKKNHLWFHVDACYGGGHLFCQEQDEVSLLLKGADSLAIDFHKMLYQSISCSAFLIQDKKHFQLLHEHHSYLNREEDEEEGMINLVGKSLQTTRSFDALKVYMTFQLCGRGKLKEILTKSLNQVDYYRHYLRQQKDLILCEPTNLHILCFQFVPPSLKSHQINDFQKKMRQEMLKLGHCSFGQMTFRDKVYLKMTLLNPFLKDDDCEQLVMKMRTLTPMILEKFFHEHQS